jgi:hypothetical protein
MKKNYKFVSEDTFMVRRKFAEGDLDKFVNDLVKNKKIAGFVKNMKPLDIAKVVARDLDLCPRDAAKTTAKLYKKVKEINEQKFVGWWVNRKTGKDYNVRNSQGKGIHIEFVEDNPEIFGLSPEEARAYASGAAYGKNVDDLELKIFKDWIRVSGVQGSISADVFEPVTPRDIKSLQDFILKNGIKVPNIYISAFDSSFSGPESTISMKDFMVAKTVRDLRLEALNSPSIETNKQYPVPSQIRRDNTKEESILGRPQGKADITPKYDIKPHQFPPEPRQSEPGDWPYDDMTKTSMKPGEKSRKRPIMSGKDKKKYVFKQDLALNQPGGDGPGGQGIYQTARPGSGDMPGSGTSWTAKGASPGWASSPPGEEFDLPESSDEEELNIEKNPPVGCPIPKMGFGGRNPGRRMGYRRR